MKLIFGLLNQCFWAYPPEWTGELGLQVLEVETIIQSVIFCYVALYSANLLTSHCTDVDTPIWVLVGKLIIGCWVGGFDKNTPLTGLGNLVTSAGGKCDNWIGPYSFFVQEMLRFSSTYWENIIGTKVPFYRDHTLITIAFILLKVGHAMSVCKNPFCRYLRKQKEWFLFCHNFITTLSCIVCLFSSLLSCAQFENL